MEEAEKLCDHIIIIDHGKILKQGTLNTLLDEEDGHKVVTFNLQGANEYPEDWQQKSPFQKCDIPFDRLMLQKL